MQVTALTLLMLSAEPHRLDSRREAGAESCPDEQALQRAVAERLGLNPFSSDAARTVSVRWKTSEAGFSAELSVTTETGATIGSRKLSSSKKDCSELAASTALALALIIDPLSLTRGPAPAPEPEALPPPPPPPSSSVEPEPPPPAPPAPPPIVVIEQPPAPPPVEHSLWLGGALGLSLGEVPSTVSAALELSAGWKSRWLLIGARGTFVAPGISAQPTGNLGALVFGLGPFLCAGASRAGGCASLRLGATYAWPSGFPEASAQRPAASFSAAIALGPYLDFAPVEELRVRLFVNGQLQPTVAVLVVKNDEVWRSSLFSLQTGVSIFALP
jgi:hypothetical protein